MIKNTRVRLIISFVCIGIVLGCIAVFIGTTLIRDDVAESYAEIQDSALMSYAACMEYTEDLKYLYGICDEKTYQQAKTNMKMSEKMYKRYFNTEKYNGTIRDISCRIIDVKCAVPEETVGLTADSTYKYLVTLQQIDNKTDLATVTYVIVTYTDGVLCDLKVL